MKSNAQVPADCQVGFMFYLRVDAVGNCQAVTVLGASHPEKGMSAWYVGMSGEAFKEQRWKAERYSIVVVQLQCKMRIDDMCCIFDPGSGSS